MTDEQFVALVERLEQLPADRYRRRLAALSLLGYAFILAVLVASVGLLGGIALLAISGHFSALLVKPGILLIIFIFTILRSMWVTFPKPSGVPVRRSDVPALFAMLDDVCAKLAAPRVDRVLLVDDFNAGVMQWPRLGILGWPVNYLMLGLPLMQSTTPERFKAIIAHEMGHLSANHSRFAGRIYRLRTTYLRILGALHGHSSAFNLFARFFNWYAPYFEAYSFVLARADEYEADRCAAEVSGARTAAEALVDIGIKGRFFHEAFLRQIYRRTAIESQPPVSAFVAFPDAMRQPIGKGKVNRWLQEQLREERDVTDTHPSLLQRLNALGFDPTGGKAGLPSVSVDGAPPGRTAADVYLAGLGADDAQAVARQWRSSIERDWSRAHSQAQADMNKLAQLDERAAREALADDDELERIGLTMYLRGVPDGVALLRAFVEARSQNGKAAAMLGERLLEMGDPSGIAHLERARALAPEVTAAACDLIADYLEDHEQPEEAAPYRAAAEERRRLEQEAGKRLVLAPEDRFLPHDLPDELIQKAAEPFAKIPMISRVYLVRKDAAYLDDRPIFILGLVTTGMPGGDHNEIVQLKVQAAHNLQSIMPNLGGATLITYLEPGDEDAIHRAAIEGVPGSLIYPRGQS